MGDGCARHRQRLSQRVDGELALTERPLLLVHLVHCTECREFGSELTRLTAELRGRRAHGHRLAATRAPAIAGIAAVLLAAVISFQGLRPHAASAVGALSPVQGMPVYDVPGHLQGFPVYVDKHHATF